MRRLSSRCSRRAFLRAGALAPALLAAQGAPQARADGVSRVGVARCARVLGEKGVDAEVVGRMIDEAVLWVTGANDADAAWASLFSSDEIVGVKPNGLGGFECSTAPEILKHCVARLQGLGVKPGNIVVWEETAGQLDACGVPPGEPPMGMRALVTHDHMGAKVTNGSFTDNLFAPLLDEIDAVLNLPILKAHPICGVTLAMKNHYGSIGHPSAQHHEQCHPGIVDLADMPAIRDKTRLVVCDGTRARIEGQAFGLPQYLPNIVMAATDVVAHDSVGARIIEEERERQGMRPLRDEGLEPRYIRMAEERGLGAADWEAIDARVIDLD